MKKNFRILLQECYESEEENKEGRMGRVESLRTENKLKKTEIGEIPVDWEVAKVQDVCEKPEYGYTESATEKPIGPKFLRISDIQDGKVNWEKVPFCHCPNSIKEKYILKPGDILFARTGTTTGKSYIIKKCPEAVFASYLIRVVTKGRINSNFLYLVFNSFIYWRQIKEQIGGSAQGGVNASSLSSIKVPLPPLHEQKRIAEILASTDEAIEKKQEIIEKTKMLKKGLMQELLTRGIRHKKFKKTKIGELPVDWEVKTLLNAVGGRNDQIVAGPFGSNLKVKDYKDEGIPIIRLQNIEFCKFISKDIKYISSKKAKELNYHAFEKGDIVLAKLGQPIGKTCIIPEFMEEGIVVADVVRIRIDEQFSNKKFIMYVLNSFHCLNQLNKEIIGTTRPRVNLNQVRNLLMPYLPLHEQKKIAEVLTSVDEEIEDEMAHKERLESIKKGLMQVLLTGKIRTKI